MIVQKKKLIMKYSTVQHDAMYCPKTSEQNFQRSATSPNSKRKKRVRELEEEMARIISSASGPNLQAVRTLIAPPPRRRPAATHSALPRRNK